MICVRCKNSAEARGARKWQPYRGIEGRVFLTEHVPNIPARMQKWETQRRARNWRVYRRKWDLYIFVAKFLTYYLECKIERPKGGAQNPVFYRLKLTLACGKKIEEALFEPCPKWSRKSMYKNMRGLQDFELAVRFSWYLSYVWHSKWFCTRTSMFWM